jgi:hypothetical protein
MVSSGIGIPGFKPETCWRLVACVKPVPLSCMAAAKSSIREPAAVRRCSLNTEGRVEDA